MNPRRSKNKKKKTKSTASVGVSFYRVIWSMVLVALAYIIRVSAGQLSTPRLVEVNDMADQVNPPLPEKGGEEIVTVPDNVTKSKMKKPRATIKKKKSGLAGKPKDIKSEKKKYKHSTPERLTFSIIPDEDVLGLFGKRKSKNPKLKIRKDKEEKSEATTLEDKAKAKNKAFRSNKTTPRVFSQPLWRRLKVLVSNVRVKLIEDSPHGYDVKPVDIFISNLAFLYRYHLLNLALKVLTREGYDKYQLHRVRTDIVHKINTQLFDPKMIFETKEMLAQLDLHELNELSSTHQKIDAFEISEVMVSLPLTKYLSESPEISKFNLKSTDVMGWLKSTGVPLLNTIAAAREKHKNTSSCDDAIKMLIIIMGEYCPKNDTGDENKFVPVNTGVPSDFLSDCRGLRNVYAHLALTDGHDQDLEDFILAYRQLNPIVIKDDNPHFDKMLSPQKTKNHFLEVNRRNASK